MSLKSLKVVAMIASCVACFTAATIATQAQVWSNGYSYRSTITIDHTKVPNTDQTNFPVLVSGTYSYLATAANGGDVTNSNGYDVIFTSDAAGTDVLPFERESYDASTGAVLYWVQVPTVSHTADTSVYLFYGNISATTDQSNKNGVWDGNYLGVWHLPNGSALSGTDSTSNGFNLTNNNSTGATTGQIDGGASLNGTNNYLSNSSLSITAGSSVTISYWSYVPSASVQNAVAFSIGGADIPNRIMASVPWSDDNVYWDYGSYSGGGRVSASYSSYLNSWTHVVLEYDASTTQHLLYFNGTLASSSTNSNAPTSNESGIWLGVWSASNGYYHKGTMDEFRVSTTARSADWISAEYNNQNSPSTFYAATTPSSGSVTPPSITSLSPTSGPAGASITITGTAFGSSTGSVTFNGTSASPTSWTSTSITVPVPTGASTGNVIVKVGSVPSNAESFTVIPTPTISSLSPSSGPPGVSITITGTNFGSTQGSSTITFSGVSATPTSWSATSIVVPVPITATTGNIVVTVSSVPSSGTLFTVSSAPGIFSLSPASGMIGTVVTVVGTNFTNSQGSSTVALNGTSETVLGWSNTAISFAVPSGAASGPVVVTVNSQASNGTTFTVTPLPTGWSDTDIGSLSPAGSASYSAGTFTVNAGYSSDGDSGTSDGIHFVYQPLSGDGSITARVASVTGTALDLGIMIRETLSSGATDSFAHYYSYASAYPYFYFYYRPSTGASTGNTGSAGPLNPPYWLRIVRSGSTFTAYGSTNGLYWTQIGTAETLTMATNVEVGLYAVSQYNNGVAASVTFDNVSVSSSSNPAREINYIAPTTGTVGTQVLISGSGFGANQNGSVVTLNGTSITPTSWSNTSIGFTIPSGATTGELSLSVAPSMNYSNPEIFEVTSEPLPPTWLDQDIGGVGAQGSATYSNGVFTISGASRADNTPDAMHFVYQGLSGDGSIVARITGISSSNAQAGVMIRETLAASSDDAFEYYYDSSGGYLNFYYRATSGGSLYNQSDTSVSALPYWIKVVRSGSTFTSYVSWNGIYWVQNGSPVTVSMATDAYIGLFVGSYSGSAVTGTFDNVSVISSTSAAPAISSVSPTTASVGAQIVVSGSGFGSSQNGSIVSLNGSAVTVDTWSNTSLIITIPSGATTGPLIVSLAPVMNNSNPVMFEVTTQPLPIPWANADIGNVGASGMATYSSGTVTLTTGAGADIGGTADALQFAYQPLSGDGSLTARVVSTSGTSDISAGVMIRNSLDPADADAYMLYPSTGYPYYYLYDRTSSGAGANQEGQSGGYYSLPYSVKVVRSGSSFSGYISPDGSTWTQVGTTQTITMGTTVDIGLFVNGYSGSGTVTATFDNVSLVIGTTPVVTGLSPYLAGIGSTITVAGSNFGASQGTSTIAFDGTNASSITSWSDSQIVTVVPSGATTGPVSVTVSSVSSLANPTLEVINPVITSVTPPAAGYAGMVTITGTGFSGSQPELNFNGTYTGAYTWSDTSVTVQVPSGATSGPLTLTNQGISSNSISFTVLGTLTVTGASPTVGSVGSSVTITGTGFGATQSDSTVSFNEENAAITSWSNTSVTAIVPSGVATGPIGVTVAGISAYGPDFDLSSGAQVTDSLSNVTNYTAVVAGGQWNISNSDGSGCSTCDIRGVISHTYDGSGNILTTTDARSLTTTFTYDSNNNVTSVEQPSVTAGTPTTAYTYNNFGEVLTETDPLGHVTTNTYDANGNLTSVTTPAPSSGVAASVTHFAYNSLGELTQITDPLGHITTMTYTSAGLIYTITDPQSHVTTYGYDSRGNRTSITDALSHTTSFTYDAMNRLTQTTYPDTTTSSAAYDARGRRTSVTDQNGKTTSYAYDDADRLTSLTDAASNVTTYGYDTESNLTGITDANSHTTNFSYDAYGRVTQTSFPSTAYETYAYDADNNLTSKADRKSQTIDYVYDALNRLTEKDYPDTTKVQYTYDLIGKITGVTDPSGAYGFSYDNMNRLTGTTANYSFLSGATFTNAYTYDAASNRTGYTAPDGSTNAYSYDLLNQLTTLANSATGSFGFSYDALDRRTQMTRPNGINTNYSYDSLSRTLSVLHQTGTSTIDGASYTLDSAGNRTATTDDYASVTSNYTYDALYELTQVTQGSTTTESYSYDPVGNRTASLGVSSYTTNSSNEMTANSNAGFAYDANGNTTSKTDSTGTTGYSWDYENRLTSVTLPSSGGTVSFKYDPFGRRVEKVSPGATNVYVYDGDDLVETTDGTGAETAVYARGTNIDEPLAIKQGASIDFYEVDALGSVTSLTNGIGSVVRTYTYGSFGNQSATSGSITNSLTFSGRDFDSETGLYYDRARYLDSSSGRFISQDPLESDSDDVNAYRYVGNSCVNATDPDGLSRTYDCGAGCKIRQERDPHKGNHINWSCNGKEGCLTLPSLQLCERGKSSLPPPRILDCIKKYFRLPQPAPVPAPTPAPAKCQTAPTPARSIPPLVPIPLPTPGLPPIKFPGLPGSGMDGMPTEFPGLDWAPIFAE